MASGRVPVKGLLLTLYLGAALEDADRTQAAALRRRVGPALDRYRETGDEAEVRVAVRRVMGRRWRPTGCWAEQIRALGGVP